MLHLLSAVCASSHHSRQLLGQQRKPATSLISNSAHSSNFPLASSLVLKTAFSSSEQSRFSPSHHANNVSCSVYAPSKPSSKAKPVLFWIYGELAILFTLSLLRSAQAVDSALATSRSSGGMMRPTWRSTAMSSSWLPITASDRSASWRWISYATRIHTSRRATTRCRISDSACSGCATTSRNSAAIQTKCAFIVPVL